MKMTKFNVIDIMNEAVKGQINTDNLKVDELVEAVVDKIESIREMSFDFKYSPEMIPVIEHEGKFYVEYDMLRKLCENDDLFGDEIEVITKFGKLEFRPRKEIEDYIDRKDHEDKGEEVISEEEPEEPEDEEKEEDDDDEEEESVEEAFDSLKAKLKKDKKKSKKKDKKNCSNKAKCEAYFIDNRDPMNEYFYAPSYTSGHYCREHDALAKIFLANMPVDPNKEEMYGDEYCDGEVCDKFKMTLENTYIVIESDSEFASYLEDLSEMAKTGGICLQNGKAKLKKADEIFVNMYNHGIKLIKKKSK